MQKAKRAKQKLIHLVYKKEGETPLQALERVKPVLDAKKLTYAGRLDPLAEGWLLVLQDEACKLKDAYIGLDKQYYFEILLGASTDTHDIAGLITKTSTDKLPSKQKIKKVLKDFKGEHEFSYPLFSSKTVNGKPLFMYALEGSRPPRVPTKKVCIYKTQFLGLQKIPAKELEKEIISRLNNLTNQTSLKLKDPFRKSQALSRWKDFFANTNQKEFYILKGRVLASSGFYVRVFATELGKKLKLPALAYRIKREKIGKCKKLFGFCYIKQRVSSI